MAEASEATKTSEVQIPLETQQHLVKGIVRGQLPRGASIIVRGAVEAFQNKQAEEALEIVAGVGLPFSEGDAEQTLIENLGVRNPQTGKKEVPDQGPEKTRFNNANTAAERIRYYLDNPQESPPKELIDMVTTYLARISALKDLITDKNGQYNSSKAEEIANFLLRQPGVREKIRELYVGRLDPAKRLTNESKVNELEQDIKGLEAALGEDIDRLISEKRQEIINKQSQIQEHNKYGEYLGLHQALETLNREKAILEAQLKRAIESRATRGTSPQIEEQIVESIENIRDIDKSIVEAEGKLEEFKSNPENRSLFELMQNLNQFQQQLQALEHEKEKIDPAKRSQLQAELAEKKAQWMEARSLLLAERVKYAGEIQNIVPNAVGEYLNEAFASTSAHYREEAKKEAEKTEAENKNSLEQAVENITARFGKKLKKQGGIRMYVPDKRSAERLLQTLLLPNGVDQLFSDGELRLNEDHLMRTYGLTKEQAQVFIDKVNNDPEFKRKIGSNLAAAVFADYIGKGGRLSQDIVVALTSTTWGKDLLDNGQSKIEERRRELEKLYGQGIISRVDELKGKTKEWIRDNWKTVGWGILIILLLLGLGIGIKAGGVGLPKLG